MFLNSQSEAVNMTPERERVQDVEDEYKEDEYVDDEYEDDEYVEDEYVEDEEYSDAAKYTRRLELSDFEEETTTEGGFMSSLGFPDSFDMIDPNVIKITGIVSLVIATLVFIFLIQKKRAPRNRFMKWLREYLNFRSIVIAGIVKYAYVFLASFLTIMSIVIMFQGKDDSVLTMIIVGLIILIVGNILLRIGLELTMALIVVWENTSDIRGVIVKDEEKPKDKLPKEPKEPKDSGESEGKKAEDVEVVEEQPVVDVQSVNAQPVNVQPVVEEVAVEQVEAAQPEPVAQPGVAQPGVAQPGVSQTGAV